jgi:hypothetical protein
MGLHVLFNRAVHVATRRFEVTVHLRRQNALATGGFDLFVRLGLIGRNTFLRPHQPLFRQRLRHG